MSTFAPASAHGQIHFRVLGIAMDVSLYSRNSQFRCVLSGWKAALMNQSTCLLYKGGKVICGDGGGLS